MADTTRLPGPNADHWDWQMMAACRGADPRSSSTRTASGGPTRAARETAAKAICAGCPVRDACAAHALRVREPYGVWGGLSEDEREAHYRRARYATAS